MQARILVRLPGIQFGENFLVAGRGKDHGTLLCGNRRRVILKGRQFIRQCDAAYIRADPVDCAHEIARMKKRRHAGAAPRIGAAIAM